MAKAITLEQARAKILAGGDKPAKAQEQPGGEIACEVADGEMHITAGLGSAYVRTGEDKNKRTWYEIVYASTIKSRFLKSIRVEGPDGTRYRVQLKVTEEPVAE